MGGMGSGGGTLKDELVNAVKGYQRLGQGEKEAWWNYCDTQLEGVRDPMRHDEATLKYFVEMHDVPPAGGVPHIQGADPQKDQLVQRVKMFQKIGDEQKEAWYSFCGPNRDPGRHSVQKLTEFCNLYSVP